MQMNTPVRHSANDMRCSQPHSDSRKKQQQCNHLSDGLKLPKATEQGAASECVCVTVHVPCHGVQPVQAPFLPPGS